MFRKIILVAAIATVFSSSIAAQELSRLDFNTEKFDTFQKHARVDTLPTGYFAEKTDEAVDVSDAPAKTRVQNLIVIAGFATMMMTGGIITGLYLVKRRGAQQSTAPMVKLYI